MVLRSIGVLSCGKIVGVFYGLLGLLVIPVMLMMVLAGLAQNDAGGAAPMIIIGLLAIVGIPLMYGAIGFVWGIIVAAVYNLLAGWIGGLELEFDSVASPVVDYSQQSP